MYNNYTMNPTVTICINNNIAVINNYYGKLQDLILVFKIPMGMRTNLFDIY